MNAIASSRPINTSFGFIAIGLWSMSMAIAASLGKELGPFTTGAGVYLAGGGVGCTYLFFSGGLREQFKPAHRKYLLGCGALFVTCVTSIYLALARAKDHSQVLEVALINYLWPMLTLVFSLLVLPLRAGPWFTPGVLAALAGIGLALNHKGDLTAEQVLHNLRMHWDPYVLALMAAVSWGWYSALSRRWAGQTAGGAVPVFMLASGLLMAGASLVFKEHPDFTHHALLELGFISVASNSGYVLWDYGVRRGDLVLVASASYFTPLLSTMFTCFYLGTRAGHRLWLGCGLVLGGAVLCKLSVKEQAVANQRD